MNCKGNPLHHHPKLQTQFWPGVDSGFKGSEANTSFFLLGGSLLFIKRNTKTLYFCKVYNSRFYHHVRTLLPLSCVPLREESWNISFLRCISFTTSLPPVTSITANCSWNQDLNGDVGSNTHFYFFLEHNPVGSLPSGPCLLRTSAIQALYLDCFSTSINSNPVNAWFL